MPSLVIYDIVYSSIHYSKRANTAINTYNYFVYHRLPSDDYRRVSHLERHEKSRPPSNIFQHTLMARFLTKCLAEAGYFGETPKSEDLITIGGIILRSLQFIQFNTHEVAELHAKKADGNEKTVFIGGGLYPTLALFNHSCDPGVVRWILCRSY